MPEPESAARDGAPIRIGLVGLGMAGSAMISSIVADKRYVIAAAADRHAPHRARFAQDFGVPVFDDAEALMRSEAVDAVYIATPHELHCRHALAAAENGKHAIIEKPMALSLSDCDAMIAAAREAGVIQIVGHTHGFDPAVKAMRREIAGGALGALMMLQLFNYTDFLYRPRRPEELDAAKGGGVVYNQLPHQIDIARYLAASPVVTVRAAAFAPDPRRPVDTSVMAFLGFASGAGASITYSGADHFDSDEFHNWVSSTGQTKVAKHGAQRQALKALDASKEVELRQTALGYGSSRETAIRHQPHFGIVIASCERGDLRPSLDGVSVYSEDGVREIALPPVRGRAGRMEVLNEFYAQVREGAPAEHDGAFARGTVATCLAVLRSAKEGREVTVD
jgi:phthalate 4,5-cis-dihydrodiol dehydrogenase